MSEAQRTHGGLSVKTLLIAGTASAVAALLIPMVWRPGTVFAAAMTPVVVALVSELLRRPAETVSSVRVRRTSRGTAILDPPPEEPFDPLAPPSTAELQTLPRATAQTSAVHRRPLTGRQWRLALITGLVAFAAVAALFTASELIAGDAVSSRSGSTTFFGGGNARNQADKPAQEDEERKGKDATPTPTPTATPEATATPTPTATPTATPTPPAAEAPAAPPPAEATPAP